MIAGSGPTFLILKETVFWFLTRRQVRFDSVNMTSNDLLRADVEN